jgi:hypothetical protein
MLGEILPKPHRVLGQVAVEVLAREGEVSLPEAHLTRLRREHGLAGQRSSADHFATLL